MIDISKWAFENKKLIYFLIAVLIVGGAYSSYEMSKLEDPEITVKLAMVVTTYPGASAHQVELEVTDVLEKSIRSMKDIGEVTSRSMNDMSLINVSLSTLVSKEETEQCWDILRRKVADVQAELPEGASVSVVMDDFGDVFGIYYGLTADDGFTYEEMRNWAERIKTQVVTADGVMKVALFGVQTEVVNIFVSTNKLVGMGIDPKQLANLLQSQNQIINTG